MMCIYYAVRIYSNLSFEPPIYKINYSKQSLGILNSCFVLYSADLWLTQLWWT